MYQTYIIYSSSRDRFYIGHTSVGARKRLERHNEGWTRSTQSGIPWDLLYVKSFDQKSEAIKWEYFIKRQKSRSFIQKLIDGTENEL